MGRKVSWGAYFKWALIVMIVGLVRESAATDLKEKFKDIYRLYSSGAYAQAVEDLSAIPSQDLTIDQKITIAYWKGLSLNRMQSFDRAAVSLKEAADLGADFKDLQYELGQAYYASQSLKAALAAFDHSVGLKYKVGASLYYKGFINQILEDYAAAVSTYKAILQLPDDTENVKEGSLLQIAELELNVAMAEKDLNKRKVRINQRVVPAFQDVIHYADKGPAADEARKSLAVLQPNAPELKKEGPKFRNGESIPAQLWSLRVSSDLKYDSNVIFQANNAIIRVSDAASLVSKLDVGGHYTTIWDRQFVVTPEIAVNYTRNLNRKVIEVIENDMISMTGYLRTRWEHKVFKSPSAMSFDVEYNYTLRDYLGQNAMPYYSSYINLTYGNRVQFIKLGSTSLNLNTKWFFSEDPTQSAFNPAVVLSQNFNLGKVALTESFGFDWNSTFLNSSTSPYDRVDYRITSAMNVPEFFWKTMLSAVLDLTFVNTENLFKTRGLEKTINASLTWIKPLGSRLSMNLNYSYATNISLDTVNYAYRKMTAGFGLSYRM